MSNRCSAPYTLCLFEAFPSRGNEKYGEEKQRVIYFMYHSAVSPFGGERHMDKPLWGLRVQAPFGARVLSFVCCAPNDGFGPQSGLVQRVVLYAAAWGSENLYNRPAGEELHSPFGGWRHHLPPGGGTLFFAMR